MRPFRLLLLVVALLGLTGCNAGGPPQFNFLLGYGHVEQDGSGGFDPIVHDEGGGRAAVGMDTGTSDNGSGPRLGGRLVYSTFRDDLGETSPPGLFGIGFEDFIDLTLFTPQFVASYRQLLGDPESGGAFIEPGIGLGLSLGVLVFGSDVTFGDEVLATDYGDSETEVGPSANPFLRAGYQNDRLLLGIEGGYQWTLIDFDELGADPTEWYVGVFFAVPLGD